MRQRVASIIRICCQKSGEKFFASLLSSYLKLISLGVLCASAGNKLGNNRRDAEFAESICFAQWRRPLGYLS